MHCFRASLSAPASSLRSVALERKAAALTGDLKKELKRQMAALNEEFEALDANEEFAALNSDK